MRIPIFISLLLHVVFFTVLLILPSRPYSWSKVPRIYQVELISLPAMVEKVVIKAEKQPQIKEAELPAIAPPIQKKVAQTPSMEKKDEPTKHRLGEMEQREGASGSQFKVDAKDFPFAYYLSILRYRVQENWQPPYQTLEAKEKLTAVIGFRVMRNGEIININLENSSGRFLFDQAAQRAVHAVIRLPPLPDEFYGDFLSVHIEFEAVW